MKTRYFILLYSGLFMLVSGCTVGPNYHPPRNSAPADWSERQRGGLSQSAVKIIEWWKTFNDPKLNSLIERAVQANYDLRLAEGRLHESRATRSGSLWNFGPTINATGSAKSRQFSRNSLISGINQQATGGAPAVGGGTPRLGSDLYDAFFDATWELDLFGSKRRALEVSSANVAAGEEDRRDVLVTVLGDVARNYVEVRGAQERLAIARKNIAAQSQSIELAQARFKAGLTSELDVSQAEALLATTEATVPNLETTMKQAIHRLGVLLGQPPGTLLADLSTDKPIPATPPHIPVGMPSDLLRRRPDVRRAERQLASATADIGVQTAELFPKFSLVGTRGQQSLHTSDFLTGGSRYWSAGPSVTWRLLDFGRVRALIKGANARQEQALATYEKAVLTALEDVENSLVAYSNEQTRFKSLEKSVNANRRSVGISKELYSKGIGDFIAVLDSERALYSAEEQLVDSQRAMTVNLVTLYKALGGGWENFNRPNAKG